MQFCVRRESENKQNGVKVKPEDDPIEILDVHVSIVSERNQYWAGIEQK